MYRSWLYQYRYLQSENNAVESAKFAQQYLQNKLEPNELNIIVNAIYCHDKETFDFQSNNDVAWIVFMADKMDITRSRYIKNLIDNNAKHKVGYNIFKIDLEQLENGVNVNMILFKEDIKNLEMHKFLLNLYKTILNHFNINNIKLNLIVKKNATLCHNI